MLSIRVDFFTSKANRDQLRVMNVFTNVLTNLKKKKLIYQAFGPRLACQLDLINGHQIVLGNKKKTKKQTPECAK